MKYLITMKDGTTYTDEQPDWWLNWVSEKMIETKSPMFHESERFGFVVACTEIAHVRRMNPPWVSGEGQS